MYSWEGREGREREGREGRTEGEKGERREEEEGERGGRSDAVLSFHHISLASSNTPYNQCSVCTSSSVKT